MRLHRVAPYPCCAMYGRAYATCCAKVPRSGDHGLLTQSDPSRCQFEPIRGEMKMLGRCDGYRLAAAWIMMSNVWPFLPRRAPMKQMRSPSRNGSKVGEATALFRTSKGYRTSVMAGCFLL